MNRAEEEVLLTPALEELARMKMALFDEHCSKPVHRDQQTSARKIIRRPLNKMQQPSRNSKILMRSEISIPAAGS